MLRYAITIFLSAFLLFQIQPLIARLILPRFGGTASVWTTCVMFFQLVLLLGYAYVHLLRRIFPPRLSWTIHVALLVTAAISLRLVGIDHWVPADPSNMTWSIVQLLAITIGVPFLALSTTGPLVQAWHCTTHLPAQNAAELPDGRSTYRLYALSNLGSMVALLSYPFVMERFLELGQQQVIWTNGFYAFCLLASISGFQTLRFSTWHDTSHDATNKPSNVRKASPPVSVSLWIVLSAVASVLLLSTTQLICQEIASFPFLWILPLVLYLTSLIICFDRSSWYQRRVFLPLLLLSIFVCIPLVHLGTSSSLVVHVLGLSAIVFASSMVCHGELYRLRPPTTDLTLFYLCVALGGAIGGVLAVVVAPLVFSGFYEFQLALLVCLLIPLVIVVRQILESGRKFSGVFWCYAGTSLIAVSLVICSLVYYLDPNFHPDLLFRDRNEYGLISVLEANDYRTLVNGQTDHGGQYVSKQDSLVPNSYYIAGSGAAIAFECIRNWRTSEQTGDSQPGINVGVIGLGCGSLVAWAEPGDEFCFYEINPLVKQVAEQYFTYLQQTHAEVVLGDGRVSLERELAERGSRNFDLLFVDAFTSDSIPMHLLTRECFELYWKHLKADGILTIHISNRYVDLRPVIHSLAIDSGLTPILLDHYNAETDSQTRWILVTRNRQVIDSSQIKSLAKAWPRNMPNIRWTDQDASLAPVVIWTGGIGLEEVFKRRLQRQFDQQHANSNAVSNPTLPQQN